MPVQSINAVSRILIVIAALFLMAPIATGNTPAYRVALFVSNDMDAYKNTIEGIKWQFSEANIRVDWDVFNLSGKPENALADIQKTEKNGTQLIITLGNIATETVCQKISRVPIVASMILNDSSLLASSNATGVTLAFRPELTLQWILNVLPKVKTIGVLYDPSENQATIEKAQETAKKLGLTIYAVAVNESKELPRAIEKVLKHSDAIWGIPDPMTLNTKTAKRILLASFRHRIPFVGPSATWAKAGAFLAFGYDYFKMGTQCSDVAFRIL